MDISNYLIDELVYMREQSRIDKDFKTSDLIRDYLDIKGVFVFDTPNGQEVWHYPNQTRQGLVEEINRKNRSEKIFNSWLYSINCSISKEVIVN